MEVRVLQIQIVNSRGGEIGEEIGVTGIYCSTIIVAVVCRVCV